MRQNAIDMDYSLNEYGLKNKETGELMKLNSEEELFKILEVPYMKPENRNIYPAMEAGKQVKKLPMSLGEALDRLAKDDVIKSSMPDEMYKIFHWYKNDEWERFMHTTTEWDLDTYLDCLPIFNLSDIYYPDILITRYL